MFKKGKSGNPNGRPIGAKSKAKTDLLSRVTEILDNNVDRLQTDFDKLEPAERVKAFTNLIGYVVPKKQAVNVQQSLDYEYEKMKELLQIAPEDVIDKIAERMKIMMEENGE